MRRLPAVIVALSLFAVLVTGCYPPPSSDDAQREQQEAVLDNATKAVPSPAVTNFREKRLLKEIYELRDNATITTYVYLFSQMDGRLVYFGEAVGYGIPYSTQYSSPEVMKRWTVKSRVSGVRHAYGIERLPQAEPNGLYSPANADGTWVFMKDPDSDQVLPVFIEPQCIVSPFRLHTE